MLMTGAWCCQDNVHGGSRLAHNGAAGLLLCSNVGVSGVQNKMLGWMAKIAKTLQELNILNGFVLLRNYFVLSPLLLIHRAWSLSLVLPKKFIRVLHSWESRGENNARKFLNFYPKKPHTWWRFSIYASAMIICQPHERLLGQDICQLALAFCLVALLFLHA